MQGLQMWSNAVVAFHASHHFALAKAVAAKALINLPFYGGKVSRVLGLSEAIDCIKLLAFVAKVLID